MRDSSLPKAPFLSRLNHWGWPVGILLALWSVMVLPSVFFSDWFTLDVGYLLTTGREFPGNLMQILSPYDGSGRYFPVYFLFNFIQVRLFGNDLGDYYVVQSVMFLMASSATCYLLYRITRNFAATALLVVLVYFSTPNTENLFTIGKPEPIAYFCVIFIFLFAYLAQQAQRRVWPLYLGIVILFCLAVLSKETSVVLLGVFPTALVGSFLARKLELFRNGSKYYLGKYTPLLLALLAGMAVARIPYLAFDNVTTNTHSYTDYEITLPLIWKNFYFYLTQQPDIAFYGLSAVGLLLLVLRRVQKGAMRLSAADEANMIFVTGVLAVGWAYYIGLLFWRWPMAYYLYLPSLLFRVAAVYALYLTLRENLLTRRQLRIMASFIGLTLAYALVYWFYVSTAQISYSKMYAEAMKKYVELAQGNKEHRLVIESYQFYAEQRGNTPLALKLIANDDYRVDGIADQVDPAVNTPEMMKLLHVTPEDIDANEVNMPRQNDYLLVMTGDKLATWFVRGVTPYYSPDSILHKEGAYDMELVAEDRIYTPTLFPHVWTTSVEARPTYLGYKLYRITGKEPNFFWRFKFPDGWMGKHATLRVYPEYADRFTVTVSTPDFLPTNRLIVRQEGKVVKELPMEAGQEYSFELTRDKAQVPNHFSFDVENTVVPKSIKINKDTREIGILIRIDPVKKEAAKAE